jgi:hypothetical protein
MSETNLYEYEGYITHNIDEVEKQLDTIMLQIQILKNEIETFNRMKATIVFHEGRQKEKQE